MLQFLNPLLLLGTLAFLVPLIIHLLNRQRFRRRRWAAMEFLLAAYKKQRKRLRTENLILLLLRCLLPILLALAIARPILRADGDLPGLSSRAHHIIVLDASYSMGYREADGVSAFERARTLIRQVLDDVETQQTHRVSLIVAGQFARRALVEGNATRAKAALVGEPRPEDGAADLADAMSIARELVESPSDAEPVVYVFSDLQERAFGRDLESKGDTPGTPVPNDEDPEAGNQDSLQDSVEAIRDAGTEVLVFDVGPMGRAGGSRPNAQVTTLELRQPAAVVRVATPVVARVRNFGIKPVTAWVTLEVDGGQPVREKVELAPGAEGEAEFAVVFRETGPREIRASLDGDELDADDERFAVVTVRERLKILVVEGRLDEDDPELRDATEVLRLLDPTGGEGPPELTVFAPKVIQPLELFAGREDPSDYDLTILANVPQMTPRAAQSIERALQAGKGLLVMVGDQVEGQNYDLAINESGAGWMPLRLDASVGYEPGGQNYYRSEIVDPDHPTFADLEEEAYRELLQNIPIYRAARILEGSLHEDAQVLLRMKDPGQTPLLVAHRHGNGRVAVLTSSISARPDRWNRLEDPIVALALFHSLAYWLTLPAADPFNVDVGTVLSCSLPHRPTEVTVQEPQRKGGARAPVGDDSRALPGKRFSLPPWTRTTAAGFYRFDMQLERDLGREPFALPFAVNVRSEEGKLDYVAHDVAADHLGLERIYRALPGEGELQSRAGRTDLGGFFLWVLLFVLLAEGGWARFIARRRS